MIGNKVLYQMVEQINKEEITNELKATLIIDLYRLNRCKNNYINQIKGFYITRNKKAKWFTDEKTFNDFNLSDKEFKDKILKVIDEEFDSNSGYTTLKSRHTFTGEHVYKESKRYFKVSNEAITYLKVLYYNGKYSDGTPRYQNLWMCASHDIDVHHINGNKKDNRSGNTEKLNMYNHQFIENLKVLVDKKIMSSMKADKILWDLKHNKITLEEAQQQKAQYLKDKGF